MKERPVRRALSAAVTLVACLASVSARAGDFTGPISLPFGPDVTFSGPPGIAAATADLHFSGTLADEGLTLRWDPSGPLITFGPQTIPHLGHFTLTHAGVIHSYALAGETGNSFFNSFTFTRAQVTDAVFSQPAITRFAVLEILSNGTVHESGYIDFDSSTVDTAASRVFFPGIVANLHSATNAAMAGVWYLQAPVTVQAGPRAIRIDIRPDSETNSISLESSGSIPVAIFGAADLDVTDIATDTISLAGAHVRRSGNGRRLVRYEDVDADGHLDLVASIDARDLQIGRADTTALLDAELVGGASVRGQDSVSVRGSRRQ
jgi:hypothetical protein